MRILVMCGNDAPPVRAANTYAALLAGQEVRFLEERVLTPRRIAVFSLRRLKRRGLLSLFGAYLYYLDKLLSGQKPEPKQYRPERISANFSRDPAVAEYIRSFRPDIILIGFCGLLSPAFLQNAGCAVVNTHPGITPRYRGFGNIWAFYEDNAACAGYTIHEVDAGTDTGKRLAVSAVDFSGIPFAEIDAHAAGLAARRLAGILLGQEEAGVPEAFADLPSACYGVPTWSVQRKARENYERLYGGRTVSGRATPCRHILITGAGGGLGRALAASYAGPGTHLTLWGRDAGRLAATAAICRDKGATSASALQDIRDLEKTRVLLAAIDEERPVDLAFLNAGVSSGTLPGGGTEAVADACRIIEVNATGAINMAGLLLSRMAERKAGHLVFTSSLAALHPLPDSPAYCAAKSAVASYAKAMRFALAHLPIRVSVLYPGYVDTPMSRRVCGPQPLRWSAEKAAAHIRDRLAAGSDFIAFPRLLAFGALLLHALPFPLVRFFLRRFGFAIRPDAESPNG